MTMRTISLIGATFTAALLIGCASVGRPIDPDKLSQVIRGQSNMRDVVALLGEPQNVSEVDGPTGKHTDLHYLYSYAAADGKNFIPYYGSFVQEYHTKTQDVTITLDSRGIVESINKNFGGISSKAGVAAEQPKAKETTQATLAPKAPPAVVQPMPQVKQQLVASAPAIREKFKQVQVGMSEPEVTKLMGEPSVKEGSIWKWQINSTTGQAWIGFSRGKVAMLSWQDSR